MRLWAKQYVAPEYGESGTPVSNSSQNANHAATGVVIGAGAASTTVTSTSQTVTPTVTPPGNNVTTTTPQTQETIPEAHNSTPKTVESANTGEYSQQQVTQNVTNNTQTGSDGKGNGDSTSTSTTTGSTSANTTASTTPRPTSPPPATSTTTTASSRPSNAGSSSATTTTSSSTATSSSSSSNAAVTSWGWPTQGRVTGKFSSATNGNKGIDIAGQEGQPIYATAGGTVVYAGNALRGYGNLIIVKHNNEYLSAYAHNDQILVKENEAVNAGQQIATMGSSGAQDVKLHFEIRHRGKSVDPLKYLK
uniref:peptidoglycan DD-metalloendopeptidase family protein n=1 Tax=Thaumasiovibrio occultus TaxID=1891184 RepID=UPI000B35508A|nr:peptidoglycan DD-metalloendopeptidase family protein [Thaumasiovibrio occultus]